MRPARGFGRFPPTLNLRRAWARAVSPGPHAIPHAKSGYSAARTGSQQKPCASVSETGTGRRKRNRSSVGDAARVCRRVGHQAPTHPPILRTAKTIGTGLLAAVALLITGTEASAAPTGSPCSAAAVACVDLSSQQAWLVRGGNVTYGPVPVATGKASAPTAPGTLT